jgi:type IV fimbrial biogenesis protein FimT
MSTARSHTGFTLIEMMVALLIAAIVMTAGVPALQSMVRRQRLVSAANDFFHAAHLTRATALRYGNSATMQPPETRNWRHGWEIWVDNKLVMTRPALHEGISVTYNNRKENLIYDAQGMTTDKGTWAFKDGDNERRIIINFLGRIRMCDPARKGSC